MNNKPIIQHAFGVEPMCAKDLPDQKLNKFNELGHRAGLKLDNLSLTLGDDVCFGLADLVKFFQVVVEDCAVVAEQQARIYSHGDAGDGCHRAASAIRTYGKQHE
jgi:hypothetical protein